MNQTSTTLNALYARIPRRHTSDNVKEIYSILDEYEELLQSIEAENSFYEQHIAEFFDALEPIRNTIKKSNDNKASKKTKDDLFDEGSGALKDAMDALTAFYDDGKRQ
ncbi:MAG: hypothetical protein JWQ27_2366 [Ferruginibacter sp.]|nr:hypothetical protein [Ferruginibacter sp.]